MLWGTFHVGQPRLLLHRCPRTLVSDFRQRRALALWCLSRLVVGSTGVGQTSVQPESFHRRRQRKGYLLHREQQHASAVSRNDYTQETARGSCSRELVQFVTRFICFQDLSRTKAICHCCNGIKTGEAKIEKGLRYFATAATVFVYTCSSEALTGRGIEPRKRLDLKHHRSSCTAIRQASP